MPHNTDDTKQTVFFLLFRLTFLYRKHLNATTQARKMYERQQIDIVVWSLRGNIYQQFWNWLPKQNVIKDYLFNKPKFDPHLHQLLLDQMINPKYDWRQRYTKDIKVQCQTSKRLRLFFWITSRGKRLLSCDFWNKVLMDVVSNTTFHKVDFFFDKVHYSDVLKEAWEAEENNEVKVIHLPLSYERVLREYFSLWTFYDENTIDIVVSSSIDESPVLQNGTVVMREEDY